MGRKPNQLILEFFERGQKLEDSSNRYQHTCRACGEKFPKGRIDSLTTHLVKKCPAISLRDRQKALLQLNDLPDITDARNQANPSSVELPVGNRNWTALETLAEVSRQIDLSEKQDDRTQHNHSADPRPEETPRIDRFELQEQWTPDNPPLSYEARVQRDKKLLSQKLTPRRDSESTLPPANFAQENAPSTSPPPPLNMAAATSMAVAASARFTSSMVDPQLFGEGLPQEISESLASDINSLKDSTINDQYFVHRPADQPTWPMLDGSGGNMYPDPEGFESHVEEPRAQQQQQQNFPRAIAINTGMTTEFSAEYGNGQRANKPKVRGRFTPNRRKEVQEVRKRGACIRCRMLKKPCSGETPCNTCRNVESARLWKQPCMRTRLADELDMYSAGLHAVLAYHEVNAAKSRVNFTASANQIEASHYPETNIYAGFNALEGQDLPSEKNIDPILGLNIDFSSENLRILDNDNDDLPMKIEGYAQRMSPIFFEKEPSHFMNVTLSVAMELSIQKQDSLLSRALELWATVHILVDHELKWSLSERRTMGDESSESHPIDPQGTTYQLLCMQLSAAVEKKAAQTSKLVLNDLERRLLQRSSTSSFETFLVAIILLNCVEKSTWLFKSWEQDYLKARWPLDKTPIWYGSQGDRITDMLQMLLRMRNIPPKTYARMPDGILATELDSTVQNYFEKLNLSHADVLDKQNNATFDPADSRCYELRFCSKLLLPMG
ncbi:hypothetical protein V497_04769 [Pseudogymnoascus sp. VKM F-4516 (FW-969)]|nr:hypothetical protein V497_04769 [Pseudogymnoascus sp. VKM F-4516 (FW-969)]